MLYHSQRGKAVDAIVHREQAFQPARFWVVPPDSQTWLPTEDVVRRHCHGMQIKPGAAQDSSGRRAPLQMIRLKLFS